MIVDACWRGEPGTGSPTAVVDDDAGLTDADRARAPADLGVSHAVFVDRAAPVRSLRFFTAAGELPACGHATLAAVAVLEDWDGRDDWLLRTPGRTFKAGTTAEGAFFDAGVSGHRVPAAGEAAPVLAALGAVPAGAVHAAGGARERLLVPVEADRLGALVPDFGALAAACDAAGLLGCFVYAPVREGWFAARMFAPSIGVPEDAANANSTAALAGVLAGDGPGSVRVVVSMGESVGAPSRIRAEAFPAAGGARVHVVGRVGPPRGVG
ncbi:PhzF family phenazine biosynthesis protein [Glycomyces endophyticus]|uniref:PhzF family phenazine biosynthesis protein n=1 Tax=Glycomyces endophyticus TaxID=480996 RepID=A0ABP4TTQ9_9ACTN